MSKPSETSPKLAIRLRGVGKTYKLPRRQTRVAVADLNLDVPCGKIFGFLGANGAGKTTTIKMLLGFLEPTAGTLEIFGETTSEHTTRRHVGYLPEQPYSPPFLSPVEVLRLHGELIGLERKEREGQIEDLLALTRLEKNRDLPLNKLSKGNQQRVGIAQALLGSPRLLILDEPTSGLDPVGRHEVRNIIAHLKNQGKTVFLSSHVLSEVDTLCDEVGILNQGRLVCQGTPEEIKRGSNTMTIVAGRMNPAARQELEQMEAWVDMENQVLIEVAPQQVFSAISVLERHQIPLVSVGSNSESLESAFLRLAA
mgnify:CR=1 FL=1